MNIRHPTPIIINVYRDFKRDTSDFVYVEHYQRDESRWAEDALTVYESLAKNPNIDTNRVYLYGNSAGAGPVCDLPEESPKLWRGMIFHSPVRLPDPSQLSGKKIFVDCGASDLGIGRFLNPVPISGQSLKCGRSSNAAVLSRGGACH